MFINTITRSLKQSSLIRNLSKYENSPKFETVFSFPLVKYIAAINRLKVYQLAGTTIAIPTSGILEMLNIVSEHTFLTASYIGITGAAVLSIATIPFRNIIGFLYISEDNKHIKISSVDYWGKRVDRIVETDEWKPLFSMEPKKTDIFYLTPQLTDNTKYKLFMKFGNIHNGKKIGQVLE